MRFAVLGDIHANLEALDAVLDDLAGQGIDRYLCVGDIVGYAANPAECLARIGSLPAVTVAGNHDQAAAGKLDKNYFNYQAREAIAWTVAQLERKWSDFLAALPLVYRGEEATIVHGTLDNPEDFNYMVDVRSSLGSFQLLDTRVSFVGHTHLPSVFIADQQGQIRNFTAARVSIEEGAAYIINAGSVGQPRDGDPRSCYCIYDSAAGNVEFRRVSYDAARARSKILEAGLPRFLGDRLLEGR